MSTDQPAALREERDRGHGWGAVRQERWTLTEQHAVEPILDIGCSSGAYVARLRESGHRSVGIDLLPDPSWTGGSGPFVRGNAESLPFRSRAFRTVLAFEVLEHMPDAHRALLEWRRVTSGRLLLSVPNTAVPEWAPTARMTYNHFVDRTHVNFFDPQSLQSTLSSAGFAVEALIPMLPINPYPPLLDALGLPTAVVEAVGRRLRRLVLRRRYTGLLVMANVR